MPLYSWYKKDSCTAVFPKEKLTSHMWPTAKVSEKSVIIQPPLSLKLRKALRLKVKLA